MGRKRRSVARVVNAERKSVYAAYSSSIRRSPNASMSALPMRSATSYVGTSLWPVQLCSME